MNLIFERSLLGISTESTFGDRGINFNGIPVLEPFSGIQTTQNLNLDLGKYFLQKEAGSQDEHLWVKFDSSGQVPP